MWCSYASVQTARGPSLNVASMKNTFSSGSGADHIKGGEVDQQFIGMLQSYRCSGGLARAQEVFEMFKARKACDVAQLARWILERHVVSFDWQSKIWIPLFQFDRSTMALVPGLPPILATLNPIFDAWEIAHWFSLPNRGLGDCAPADTVSVDAMAVFDVAEKCAFPQEQCCST